ncbi:Transcriptional regulatory protein MoaR1 [Streptomyces sp. ADI95-17]|nr:Transcriptional regulatory protein MoaR1 [Streptomyces sp. ADI95-17]
MIDSKAAPIHHRRHFANRQSLLMLCFANFCDWIEVIGVTDVWSSKRIRIDVLGSLRLTTGPELRHTAPLTAPKPRQMIALLALPSNRTVPLSAMAQEIWGDRPPVSMRTALQIYNVQLHKFLARTLGWPTKVVAEKILVTKQDGYQFNVQHGDLDVHEFERLASAGNKALGQRDDRLAERLLTEGLWPRAERHDLHGSASGTEAGAGHTCHLLSTRDRAARDLRPRRPSRPGGTRAVTSTCLTGRSPCPAPRLRPAFLPVARLAQRAGDCRTRSAWPSPTPSTRPSSKSRPPDPTRR